MANAPGAGPNAGKVAGLGFTGDVYGSGDTGISNTFGMNKDGRGGKRESWLEEQSQERERLRREYEEGSYKDVTTDGDADDERGRKKKSSGKKDKNDHHHHQHGKKSKHKDKKEKSKSRTRSKKHEPGQESITSTEEVSDTPSFARTQTQTQTPHTTTGGGNIPATSEIMSRGVARGGKPEGPGVSGQIGAGDVPGPNPAIGAPLYPGMQEAETAERMHAMGLDPRFGPGYGYPPPHGLQIPDQGVPFGMAPGMMGVPPPGTFSNIPHGPPPPPPPQQGEAAAYLNGHHHNQGPVPDSITARLSGGMPPSAAGLGYDPMGGNIAWGKAPHAHMSIPPPLNASPHLFPSQSIGQPFSPSSLPPYQQFGQNWPQPPLGTSQNIPSPGQNGSQAPSPVGGGTPSNTNVTAMNPAQSPSPMPAAVNARGETPAEGAARIQRESEARMATLQDQMFKSAEASRAALARDREEREAADKEDERRRALETLGGGKHPDARMDAELNHATQSGVPSAKYVSTNIGPIKTYADSRRLSSMPGFERKHNSATPPDSGSGTDNGPEVRRVTKDTFVTETSAPSFGHFGRPFSHQVRPQAHVHEEQEFREEIPTAGGGVPIVVMRRTLSGTAGGPLGFGGLGNIGFGGMMGPKPGLKDQRSAYVETVVDDEVRLVRELSCFSC